MGRFAPDVMQDEDRVFELTVILGMDWLAQHYASLDCHEKVVIFRIPMMMNFDSEVIKVQCLRILFL